MILAKNNIIVEIEKTDPKSYAILNPVSGSFDLMSAEDHRKIERIAKGGRSDALFQAYLLQRGYAFRSQADADQAVDDAFAAFETEIALSQVQLMLVPTYGCNLACTYCFQHGVDDRPVLITRDVVDAFFAYAEKTFKDKSPKPFITLFGGEPLVNSPAQREIMTYIIEQAIAKDYELAAVTNGYDFTAYADLLAKARVKEIQFTLDGSKEIHDSRRATANKKGTFNQVVSAIDTAIQYGMPVNLRSVVDSENIEDLFNLAAFADEKGWLDLPADRFKTQIGRNYELFECYAKPQHLMTQVELWGQYAALAKQHPVLEKFHRPDFKGIRHVVDTGDMYLASFDTCPAAKTEWVFDLNGDIYGCTASCGREDFKLGSFWPQVQTEAERIHSWQKRNVREIEKCRDCQYDVICGGGCGVVAANQHEGEILSPDCRPIPELLKLGVNFYADKILEIADEHE